MKKALSVTCCLVIMIITFSGCVINKRSALTGSYVSDTEEDVILKIEDGNFEITEDGETLMSGKVGKDKSYCLEADGEKYYFSDNENEIIFEDDKFYRSFGYAHSFLSLSLAEYFGSYVGYYDGKTVEVTVSAGNRLDITENGETIRYSLSKRDDILVYQLGEISVTDGKMYLTRENNTIVLDFAANYEYSGDYCAVEAISFNNSVTERYLFLNIDPFGGYTLKSFDENGNIKLDKKGIFRDMILDTVVGIAYGSSYLSFYMPIDENNTEPIDVRFIKSHCQGKFESDGNKLTIIGTAFDLTVFQRHYTGQIIPFGDEIMLYVEFANDRLSDGYLIGAEFEENGVTLTISEESITLEKTMSLTPEKLSEI